MVKKLYKHEFLAWLRVLWVVWTITLAIAGIHRVIQLFETETIYYMIINGLAFLMYIVALLVCIATPVVFGIARFYRNFFTGEGYLTFTLPVTQGNHLWVKVSTAVCFSILSFLVCALSVSIIASGEFLLEMWKAAAYLLRGFTEKEKLHLLGWGLELVVLSIVALFGTHLLYDTCICIGQLFRKNRVLAAVGVYFGFYVLAQIFSGIFSVAMVILGETEVFLTWIAKLKTHIEAVIHGAFGIAILLGVVFALIYWLICHSILRKRLNLE